MEFGLGNKMRTTEERVKELKKQGFKGFEGIDPKSPTWMKPVNNLDAYGTDGLNFESHKKSLGASQ